jgi:hypothetical protein
MYVYLNCLQRLFVNNPKILNDALQFVLFALNCKPHLKMFSIKIRYNNAEPFPRVFEGLCTFLGKYFRDLVLQKLSPVFRRVFY